MSREDDIRELLSIHNKRLQLLRKQQATYGNKIDPSVIMEIEQIEQEIKKLQGSIGVEMTQPTALPSAKGTYQNPTQSSVEVSLPEIGEKIDFVIITPLEEERDAMLSKLPNCEKIPPVADDIHVYFYSILPTAGNGLYHIIVMPLLGMGRVQAATATDNAIRRWNPRYVILLGIAGGIEAEGVKLGDVLVADKIVDYELQKQTKEGSDIRWEIFNVSSRLLGGAKNFLDKNWIYLIDIKRPRDGQPTRHIGPIASGDKVIDIAGVLAEYRKTWSKLIGVEMEAGGVGLSALHAEKQHSFFMIRGVSDLADGKKNTRSVKKWRRYACEVAASYLIGFLKSGPVVHTSTMIPVEKNLPKKKLKPPYKILWKRETSIRPEQLFATSDCVYVVEKKAIHFFSPIDGSNILPSINTLGNLSLSDYDIVGGTVTNSNKLFLTMLPHKWNTETKAYLIVTEIKRSKLLVDIIYDTSGYQLSAPTLDKDIIYLIQSENELVVIDCRQNYHRDTKFLPQFDDLDKDCVSLVLADGYLCLALCDGKILALNSETGEFAKTLFENSDQHYLSKLVTDGWWLYFGISKKSLSHFYALDVRSGQIIWDYQSPKIMGERSLLLRKTILITLDNVLIALNADTGEEQWQYEMADRIKCGPRWTGESIVIIDRRGNMHALRFGASPKFFVTYHYNLKTPPTLNKWNPVIFTLVNKSHLTATQVIFRLRTDEFKGTSEHHTQELFTIGPGESRCCTVKFKPETSGSTVYVPITIGFQDEDGLTNQQNLELFMPIREFSNESMFSGVQESIKFDELQYNFIALRALLMAALSESDFATMCNNHFPAICAAFERNMSHMEKIELLLNYIQKQQQIKHLLVLIQNQNKICYEQYIQDILYFSIPLT